MSLIDCKIKQPIVSVVIPTYNRAVALRRCLDSIIQQTFKEFEVLVCDDGSTDKTSDIVFEYRNKINIRFLSGEHFGGPARPRNRGIKEAKGMYIAFLDSDDWYEPTKIEQSLNVINTGYDFVYTDLYIVKNIQKKPHYRISKASNPTNRMFPDILTMGLSIPNSSVVVKKSILQEIGMISEDPNLIAIEDLDTWVKCARKGVRFKRIPKPLTYYWYGGGNISQRFSEIKQIKKLRYLHGRYTDTISESDYKKINALLSYRIGRAGVVLNRISIVKAGMWRVINSNINITFKIKAIISLLFINIKRYV